jgi:dipeptidyl aminopeptidase/acylaminoacyl peptidase
LSVKRLTLADGARLILVHRITLLLLLVLGGVLVAPAQSTNVVPKDGEVISRKPVVLPAFESIKEVAQYATPAEYAKAASDGQFDLERITYGSDGLTVSAYLYRPSNSVGKYPVIVFVRGSYVVHDQGPVLLTMFHRLAKEGFVVIAPMLRGSDGMLGHDELGGNDLHDIANAFGVIRQLDFADSANVFMYGESRGGIMTLLSIRAGMPIKAAATFGAITDMASYLQLHEWEAKSAAKIWPEFEQNKTEILRSRSAQDWANDMNLPILLMHGAKDPQVPVVQTLQLAEKLSSEGKDFGVIVYPEDNHILTHNRVKRDQQVTEWFESFISAAKPQERQAELPLRR